MFDGAGAYDSRGVDWGCCSHFNSTAGSWFGVEIGPQVVACGSDVTIECTRESIGGSFGILTSELEGREWVH